MALSPFPLNPLASSSTSTHSPSPVLYFLVLQAPQTHSSTTFRTLKFKTCRSHNTTQVDTQQIKVAYNATKKKRKPRPSFYEQIRDRWSLKIASPRQKLPWQEQEQQQPIEEEQSHQLSRVLVSESGIDSVNLVSSGNRLTSAPWTHGTKPRKLQFESVTGSPQNQNSLKKGKNFDGFCVNKSVVVERSKDLEKEVNYNGKFREEVVKIDATPIGLSGGKEASLVGDGSGDSLNEKPSGADDGGFRNFEASSDNGDSIRLPWKRESDLEPVDGDRWRRSNAKLAEKFVPESELQRLRNVALRMKERIKVGAAGITQALVDSIHEKWNVDEVVKLKFEGPLAFNMKRTHEILESKTGGLVIWRSGSSLVLYRGMAYKLHCVQSYTKQNQANMNISQSSKDLVSDFTQKIGLKDLGRTTESFITESARYSKDLSEEELMDLSDLNHLLDELGPRFKDWSGRDPLPVDADLLPCVVPRYKPPFRLLPHGIRHCLRNKEMTFFRRIARTMPPHFALGRNRELQGLATAMVKLWEKSAIAKIAIKRGVQNTCNERMAEEIKRLTGGTLLSRNKDFIVFYRGNDFLPPVVTDTLVERQKLTELCQDEEEQARQRASALIDQYDRAARGPLVAGTLAETMAATSRWGSQPSSEDVEKMMSDSALARHASLVRYLEKKLALAKEKVKKAEKALGKVQEFLKPAELPTDLETISDEERFLFRKIGLSMKPYLLLGTRGVFDGTVENMHLHWKYRELVKIIVRAKSFAQVKHIAISLEAESSGVLISLDKTTKGYAIIVYRGKNYQRPRALRPKNLLTRRQALARSIELQRREALKHHISDLQERIELLKSELEETRTVKEIDDETLYSKLDDASYSSDDDMEEDEGEEAYLEIYDSGNEDSNNQNRELSLERGST